MTTTVKPIAPGALVGTVATTVYTCPANSTAILKRLALTNTSASAVTVDGYLVASGGTTSAANQAVKSKSLAAGETWCPPQIEGLTLSAAGTLQLVAGSGSAIAVLGTVMEIV